MTPLLIPLIYLGIACLIGFCGRDYRFGFWGYFFASLLFSPVIGALLVLSALPRRGKHQAS
ncbi:MAG TPA: hypothetical protein VHR86_03710 [Armatimonadota bacterium]|nr:hypothetical protein [Armatimonadota bacterium]